MLSSASFTAPLQFKPSLVSHEVRMRRGHELERPLSGRLDQGRPAPADANGPFVPARPLRTVRTPRPIHLREDSAAVEARKVFTACNLNDLMVINRPRELMGRFDIQDLPELKLR